MNAQHLPGDPDLAQVLDDAGGKGFRKLHQAVLLQDPDPTDLTGLQAGFVGDGTHQVAWLGAMGLADFHPEGLKAR